MWDYPNDFATSETRTTVPEDWTVMSNGAKINDNVNKGKGTRTVTWRIDQPHATYLISIMAGPFEVKTDTWRGIPLYMMAPKGMGDRLEYTFANTKDILSFFSDSTGVKYPYAKYAQNCTYDFGGGQENISSTHYGLFLTDPRDGDYTTDWLIAHETGHQWFGDLVTCKQWGELWLNESFADFMDYAYTAHRRGKNEAMRWMEKSSQDYFAESRRYMRPMATNFYAEDGAMFDQHSYPKGGVLIASLRNQLGTKDFNTGIKNYLQKNMHKPVESMDLCVAITESIGTNLRPWFDQWIFKPGHPVLDYSWTYDPIGKEVVLKVKQTQSTADGTPIYDIPAKVGLIRNSSDFPRIPIRLNSADQEIKIRSDLKPTAVVLDPDHEFLREIPKYNWSPEELPAILKYGSNPNERTMAMNTMLDGTPTDATVKTVVDFLKTDQGLNPAILVTSKLGDLKREDLKTFWDSELKHENFLRRTAAVNALGKMANVDVAKVKTLVDDKQPYSVVAAAITILGEADFAGSKDVILQQAKTAKNGQILNASFRALASKGTPQDIDTLYASIDEMQPDTRRSAAFNAIGQVKAEDPRLVPALRTALQSSDFGMLFGAMNIARTKKLKELIPDLEALKKRNPDFAEQVDRAIQQINS